MEKPGPEKESGRQVGTAMQNLDRIISDRHHNMPVSFEEFLETMVARPHQVLRNVFQVKPLFIFPFLRKFLRIFQIVFVLR